MFGAANPSQDFSEKLILFLELYLDFESNAHNFSQLIKCNIFDVDAALLCTVWTPVFDYKWKTSCQCPRK